MITLRRNGPNDRILELGGGENPHVQPRCMGGQDLNVDVRICHDNQGRQTVDFTADFNQPLPIKDAEWDGVFSHFVLEHVSWRNVKQLISEMFRVVKPGGKVVLIVPNTEEQLKWIQNSPEGWDGKDAFESMSCVLYGDQDYPENSHRSYFSPIIVMDLLRNAGFSEVRIQAYGARNTDMCAEAVKPSGRNLMPSMADGLTDFPEVKKEVCGASGPNGVTCILEKDHTGKHRG